MAKNKLEPLVKNILFSKRGLWVGIFAIVTAVMAYFVSQLRIDASFEKNIPLKHEYMQTYLQYQDEFGGANRVFVALEAKEGEIFTEDFFSALKESDDRVEGIEGVNQSQVQSLFSPSVRYIEASEQGLEGGPVIPPEFEQVDKEQAFDKIRENILKAGIRGRLVANDFTSAMISAQLFSEYNDPDAELELDDSGQAASQMIKTDYVKVAEQLEQLRTDIEAKYPNIEVHIIGFAKMIGDVSDGAGNVIFFFLIAFFITALLVYWYSRSIKLTILPLLTSSVAVVWQLGILTALGYGIDPMSILIPFLIFAIGVSHGVQMINGVQHNVGKGLKVYDAAIAACAGLIVPGGVALLSDTIGFMTLQLIEIDIIRELAITASIGVAVLILTNLILLPLLISYTHFPQTFVEGVQKREKSHEKWWHKLAVFAKRPMATIIAIAGVILGLIGYWGAENMKVGDLHAGAPALKQNSPYNLDTKYVTEKYSIGTDVISILAETRTDGCTYYNIMETIDDFQWQLSNVEGVQSTLSLPQISKVVNGLLSEGNLKWKMLPKDEAVLPYTIARVETSTGLLNSGCSVMPVMVFLKDHKAETIERVVGSVKTFKADYLKNEKHQVMSFLDKEFAGIEEEQRNSIKEALSPVLDSYSELSYHEDDAKPELPEFVDEQLKESTVVDESQLKQIVQTLKDELPASGFKPIKFRLATGAVGVMAATNEAVEAAQTPMMIWVYLAVTLLCLISFRSVRGTICVVLPLVVVSLLAQALMTWLEIGLTVATLPVIALGVGIGVDYGIYIFSRMVGFIREGRSVSEAYFETLKLTGNAVLFTGLTLAIGVSTWIFSALQYQADMGIMLTFMFLVNMLGAIFLLPALASILYRR
ncbi:efflux RND transporter permease subunit [Kangiella sediminilitoris]|uniref:Putative exporter of the RND superfamily protein n=1 Tax=Kangiella sediminilitoris TaxID=1144748 RepID=A0A1B3B959_9GAMM|nr:MMPL family transporter [Kangiella sediminilitoris]AOE49310.1 Putative exporter of the RND superfamily protein [Kangiella sediminilitoris]